MLAPCSLWKLLEPHIWFCSRKKEKYVVTQTPGKNWGAGLSPLSSWEQKQFFSPTHADPHGHFMGILRTERHSAPTLFKCFISTEPFPEC